MTVKLPRMRVRLFEALVGIPLAFFGLWASPYVYRGLDPTAGQFDMGIIQNILFPALAVMAFNCLAYIGAWMHSRNYKETEGQWPTRLLLHLAYLASMVAMATAL